MSVISSPLRFHSDPIRAVILGKKSRDAGFKQARLECRGSGCINSRYLKLEDLRRDLNSVLDGNFTVTCVMTHVLYDKVGKVNLRFRCEK